MLFYIGNNINYTTKGRCWPTSFLGGKKAYVCVDGTISRVLWNVEASHCIFVVCLNTMESFLNMYEKSCKLNKNLLSCLDSSACFAFLCYYSIVTLPDISIWPEYSLCRLIHGNCWHAILHLRPYFWPCPSMFLIGV